MNDGYKIFKVCVLTMFILLTSTGLNLKNSSANAVENIKGINNNNITIIILEY